MFAVELLAVACSGLPAWLHARAKGRGSRAAFGAATAIFALLALLLGVRLTLSGQGGSRRGAEQLVPSGAAPVGQGRRDPTGQPLVIIR